MALICLPRAVAPARQVAVVMAAQAVVGVALIGAAAAARLVEQGHTAAAVVVVVALLPMALTIGEKLAVMAAHTAAAVDKAVALTTIQATVLLAQAANTAEMADLPLITPRAKPLTEQIQLGWN